jgi:hypothetical protein
MRLFVIACGTLAVIGTAAFLSLIGLYVAVHVSDLEGPQGDAGWYWIGAGYLGFFVALFFGALTAVFWRRALGGRG